MGQGGDNIICLILLLAVACYFDYRKAKIPNMLVVSGLVLAVIKAVGETFLTGIRQQGKTESLLVFITEVQKDRFVVSAAGDTVQALLELTLRIGIIIAILYPFYMLGVLGAGDVKLCCMCTAFLEGTDCPGVFFVSLFLAAAAGFGKMLFLGNIRERIFYFLSYAADVARLGRPKPYWTEENSHLKAEASLRLAGPLLMGVLLQICSKM